MLKYILIAFVVGLILGINKKFLFFKKLKPVTFITLLLLFFMGYEIGNDSELISQLSNIGILAFFIAVFSIFGSVLFTGIYDKFRNKGIKK
ncbi:LysO family transporter [Oceanotoga teriensis]|uniref:LysO family transporter n=1 Tax=Oceanotoga teriensis TaxID=515440 RepID=UPI002712778A|nr:LysO family transporter [Oceanotoga teriensis]MDO7975550.1 lysine exporter LysO family protein [Oceanotoga teriensis]